MSAIEAIEAFQLEIIDEAAGEVIEFDSPELMRQFEAAEFEGWEFSHPGVRRRLIELKDQMSAMLGEIEHLLRAA